MISGRRTFGLLAAAGGLAAMEYGFRKSALYDPANPFWEQVRHAADDEFHVADEGKKVSNFSFQLQDGTKRTLADYEGRAVVLNLWATWCPPCRMEMRSLDRLAAAVGGLDIAVLPISTDLSGAPVVERLYTEQGLTHLPILLDQVGASMRAMRARALPTTLLIDREGRERERKIGSRQWDAPNAISMVRRLAT